MNPVDDISGRLRLRINRSCVSMQEEENNDSLSLSLPLFIIVNFFLCSLTKRASCDFLIDNSFDNSGQLSDRIQVVILLQNDINL